MSDIANQVPRPGFAKDGRPESAQVPVPGGAIEQASLKTAALDTVQGASKDV